MKYIFVVDDLQSKRDCMIDSAHAAFPKAQIVPCECRNELIRCLQVTFRQVVSECPDECLILLDVMMPNLRGSNIDPECGYKLLAYMAAREYPYKVILVSSEPVDVNKAKSIYDHYIGSIEYRYGVDYSDTLKKFIGEA